MEVGRCGCSVGNEQLQEKVSLTKLYDKDQMDSYEDIDKINPPQTLEELIKELHKVFASDKVNIEYVKALMTMYKSNPKEWKKFAKFDPHR